MTTIIAVVLTLVGCWVLFQWLVQEIAAIYRAVSTDRPRMADGEATLDLIAAAAALGFAGLLFK